MQKNSQIMNRIAVLGILLALEVVLGQLTQIPLLSKQYNLGFLPIAVTAYYLGIPEAIIIAGLGDIIGALLFPTGPYFPGFTITAAICGFVYGVILRRVSTRFIFRILFAVLFSLLLNWLLNSLWLSILYSSNGRSYSGWLILRAPTYLIEFPLQVVVLTLCLNGLDRLPPSVRSLLQGRKDRS